MRPLKANLKLPNPDLAENLSDFIRLSSLIKLIPEPDKVSEAGGQKVCRLDDINLHLTLLKVKLRIIYYRPGHLKPL